MYCIHFYQCNEHGNRTNRGEGRDTYLHIVNEALIRNARTTNVAVFWLEYKDVERRTSSWCTRRNENKMLIWIFHGGTCATVAYMYILPAAIHYSAGAWDVRRRAHSCSSPKSRIWWNVGTIWWFDYIWISRRRTIFCPQLGFGCSTCFWDSPPCWGYVDRGKAVRWNKKSLSTVIKVTSGEKPKRSYSHVKSKAILKAMQTRTKTRRFLSCSWPLLILSILLLNSSFFPWFTY